MFSIFKAIDLCQADSKLIQFDNLERSSTQF